MELTSDIQRDDSIVIAANAAFDRIRSHRAWEATGRRTRLDGRPEWTQDPVQSDFRKLIRDLPWAGYIQDRRDLLSVIRHMGDERERFLEWRREKNGHPDTLWRKFKAEVLRPDRDDDHDHNDEDDDSNDDRDGEQPERDDNDEGDGRDGQPNGDDDEAGARTDADRMADLVTANETCRDFCLRLRPSVNDGSSILEPGLRLDQLLDGEHAS